MVRTRSAALKCEARESHTAAVEFRRNVTYETPISDDITKTHRGGNKIKNSRTMPTNPVDGVPNKKMKHTLARKKSERCADSENGIRTEQVLSQIDNISSSDDSEWEEVEDAPTSSVKRKIPAEAVEITFSSGLRSKEDELKRLFQKAIRKIHKENREILHRITLLSYTAHLVLLSKLLNNGLLQSLALSIIPIGFTGLDKKSLDDEHILKFVKWFKDAFVVDKGIDNSFDDLESRVIDLLRRRAFNDYKEMVYIFVLLTRSMGWQSRFVLCLSISSFMSLHSDGMTQNSAAASKQLHPEKGSDATKTCSKVLKQFEKTNDKVSKKPIKPKKLVSDRELNSINCANAIINDLKSIENKAPSPILYALSVDNDNAIKDITARYNSNFVVKSVQRLRLSEDWWQGTLRLKLFKSKHALRDRLEDMYLKIHLYRITITRAHLVCHFLEAASNLPFPKTISDFKHHPLYVLKRDLLKFQVIYPLDTEPVGMFRNEPVYLRESVHTLHTRETWLKEARSVKDGDEPLKLVKGRPRMSKTDEENRMIPLFGKWQTKKFVPPVARNGIVPRNQYGNVDLFKECMLPRGTVHLHHPGMLQVAKKLDIDCAQAMIGWDFHGRSSHPVFDGVVVCQEFEKTLAEAWDQEQAIILEKEHEVKTRKRKRALKNWARFTKGLMSREAVKAKFGPGTSDYEKDEGESSKNGTVSCKIANNTEPNWLKNCDEFTFKGY